MKVIAIETPSWTDDNGEVTPTEWGVSFTDHNPKPEDYVACLTKEDAFKLQKKLERVWFCHGS